MTGHFNLKIMENHWSEGKYLVIYKPNSKTYQGRVLLPRNFNTICMNTDAYDEVIINTLVTCINLPIVDGDYIRKLNYNEFLILNQLFRRNNLTYNKKTNELIKK